MDGNNTETVGISIPTGREPGSIYKRALYISEQSELIYARAMFYARQQIFKKFKILNLKQTCSIYDAHGRNLLSNLTRTLYIKKLAKNFQWQSRWTGSQRFELSLVQ